MLSQRPASVRLFDSRNLIWRALRNNEPALISALWAEIDDPIRIPYHVKIVLNDDDGISQIGKPVDYLSSLLTSSKCSPVVGSSSR